MLQSRLRYLASPLLVVLPLVAAVALWGCSKPASEVASTGGEELAHEDGDADHDHEGSDHGDHDHGDHDHADHDHGDHEHGDASDDPLASLSDEDRALVEKQKICPVSGDELTEMGTPIKIVVNDRTLFLCCEGCKDSITEDPEKYLAKLDEQK